MHKRNIALTSLALAVVLAGTFALFPKLSHLDFLATFYFPSIIASVLLSGDSHTPSPFLAWSSFVIYTLCYWAVLFVLYAFFWEFHLLRRSLSHVDNATRSL